MKAGKFIQLAGGLIFILILLTACSGDGIDIDIEGRNWPWPWPNNSEFIVDKTFYEVVTVEDHIKIRLDSVNGEIAITGQPDASSVMVTANLQVGSDSVKDAQEGLNQLDFRVSDRPDQIFVQTLQPQDTQGRQYVVNYTITVPCDLAVEVNHVNGHVTVEEIENSVFVDVVNGNVYLSYIIGDATVSVDNGSVDGIITLPPGGEIRLSTVNGDLDLSIPNSTSAELSAFVDIGTIAWDNLDLMDTVHTNQALTGTLGGGEGLIDLETVNGNIDVTGFDG